MMPTMLDQAMQTAMRHFETGRLKEAEAGLQQIIAQEPRHAEALHMLGLLHGQAGHLPAALEYLNRAIAIDPGDAGYWSNRGELNRRCGKLREACADFLQSLQIKPDHPAAYYNLGLCLWDMGRSDEAMAATRKAIELKPDYAEAYGSLGSFLGALKQYDEAIAAYTRSIQIRPDRAEAYNNLGCVLRDSGRLPEAVGAYQQSVALNGKQPVVLKNLGLALRGLGRGQEAVAVIQRLVELDPNSTDAFNLLGCFLQEIGQTGPSIAALRKAIQLRPDFPDAYNNLSMVLNQTDRFEEAVAMGARALQIRPDYPEAHNNLGNAFQGMRRFDKAVECFERALQLRPDYAEAFNNLGGACKEMANFDRAIENLTRALELKPDYAEAHSNLAVTIRDVAQIEEAAEHFRRSFLLRPSPMYLSQLIITLLIHPDYDSQRLLAEHKPWEEQFARPLAAHIRPHDNDKSPDRRLKIGYVSPNLYMHPIGALMVPVLANHDPKNVEVVCYADAKQPDQMTDRLRQSAHLWRDTTRRSNADVAAQIREDRIDILIDLAVHTLDNRLLVFAQKPAPIQVTWLGYPGTTGLSAVDYRLSDPYLDPPGSVMAYSEKTIRLPHSFWCYQPIVVAPQVNELPAARNGWITFGCLNNFAKVTLPTQRLWGRVLAAVGNSRMQILSPPGKHRQALLDVLATYGVEAQRVQFIDRLPHDRYFEQFHQIDVALDPIPYPGHTTTLDTLWMGVPVVTRVGKTTVSRGGATLLSNVGLEDLIADSDDQYVSIAVALTEDRARLAKLRAELRPRMQRSPLTDGKRFAADLEAAYRQMWRAWCGQRS